MGLSDRDYARDSSPGFQLQPPQTAVGLLLVANIGLFIVDLLLEGRLSDRLKLSADLFQHPWNAWQLVTSAFVHDPHNLWHIAGNMFILWLFGRDVEQLYGRNEFLRIYFVAAVFSGLAWVVAQTWLVPYPSGAMLGASGAVSCIWVLFALHFPHRRILFLAVIPMPMWVAGLLNFLPDLFGFMNRLAGRPTEAVAFEAHLAGSALALAYKQLGWNFGRWLPSGVGLPGRQLTRVGRPKLKLHQPSAETSPSLEAELDRILQKISESGTDSLSPDEKRTLERASVRYQKRRN